MLLNVKEVTGKVDKLNISGKERLRILPVHIPADMLPMSAFFERSVRGQMHLGLYGYALVRVRKLYKAEEALALLWFILKFEENEGIDITTVRSLWDKINDEEAIQQLLNNFGLKK